MNEKTFFIEYMERNQRALRNLEEKKRMGDKENEKMQ